jgi:hypothetical protein
MASAPKDTTSVNTPYTQPPWATAKFAEVLADIEEQRRRTETAYRDLKSLYWWSDNVPPGFDGR